MTIIAYDRDTDKIYSDSCHTYESGRKPVLSSKIRTYLGCSYVAAGGWMCSVISKQIVEAIDKGMYTGDLAERVTIEMFVRRPDNSVLCVTGADGKFIVSACSDVTPIFQGSGASWADAYFAAGASVF